MRRGVATGGGVLAAASALYLVAWPVAVDPEAWPCPEAPTVPPNEALSTVEVWPVPASHGPEDVHVLDDGRVVAGTQDGTLWMWPAAGGEPSILARTGGRPLGLHGAPDGRILVADAFAGLLAVDPVDGTLETLMTGCDGEEMVFTDDLDVSVDGVVYVSDASSRYDQHHWKMDLLENRPHGRLLSYDLRSGACETVLDDLYFANGVALSPDGSFVLVNETSRYRVTKVWLRGERAGQREVVARNLPGFPDGISRGSGGVYWVALASPRLPAMDWTSDSPFLRRLIVRLPSWLKPAPAQHPWVLGIDEEGEVLDGLQAPHGQRVAVTTRVQEVDGTGWLGSLEWAGIARVPRP